MDILTVRGPSDIWSYHSEKYGVLLNSKLQIYRRDPHVSTCPSNSPSIFPKYVLLGSLYNTNQDRNENRNINRKLYSEQIEKVMCRLKDFNP